MSSHRSERSSRDYEREAEATRTRLAHNLHELSDRLTPGQIFDEVLTYARGGSGTFFRAFANAARANPIPSLLIGAGCMMFVSEKIGLSRLGSNTANGVARAGSRGVGTISNAASDAASHVSRGIDAASSRVTSAAQTAQSGIRSAANTASDQAASVAENLRQGVQTIGDNVSGVSQNVSQKVRGVASQVGEGMSGVADSLKQTAGGISGAVADYSGAVGQQVSQALAESQRRASRAGSDLRDVTSSFIQEQPLLCAAVGIAVGAFIAAALPRTETENELMGETSDAIKHAAVGVASDHYETAKTAATRVAQTAASAVGREVVTPFSGDVGDKIQKVVADTGNAAREEIEKFTKAEDKA